LTPLSKELAKKRILDTNHELNQNLNQNQVRAITTTDGPVQIIAGPGSGKTKVLVLRTLYTLLTGQAQPKEIILTTFTEKAAFEIRDRLSQFASKLEYKGPLNEMRIGTIHSICDDFIHQLINDAPIKRNYQVLDELTQSLFISDNFKTIFTEDTKNNNGRYLGRWQYKWETIREIIPYFNRIVDELIDVKRLLSSYNNPFLIQLAKAFLNYEQIMYNANKIDFAHQQKIVFDMLQDVRLRQEIRKDIKYIMVDEYQDTNYIQEKILLRLADPINNICIVGDEDQSLYRFRGASVRNILEFKCHFTNCQDIVLDINYRSHNKIIDFYNQFMKNKIVNWTNSRGGTNFRFDKIIRPSPNRSLEDYPAVVTISKPDEKDEAEEFADLITYLKDKEIIEDYSQVAVLLYSVRLKKSGPFIQALQRRGIPCYNPRAKRFLDNEEIKRMIGCYSFLFHLITSIPQEDLGHNNNSGNAESRIHKISNSVTVNDNNDNLSDLKSYIDACAEIIRSDIEKNSRLGQYLKNSLQEIDSLQQGQRLDMRLADYFYEIMAFEPFMKYISDENRARNLARFSQLLTIFQTHYHIDFVKEKEKEDIPRKLEDFLRFLLRSGIDDYEDPDNPVPKGYVQIMTIHQSKGLEFPVVVVGTRDDTIGDRRGIDEDLANYYHRSQFEPKDLIGTFDKMRQYYVAFSRAERLLVIAGGNGNYNDRNSINRLISPVCSNLPHWQNITTATTFSKLRISLKKPFIPKKSFGFTSDINFFEICPRRYQLYQEYKFSPSNTRSMTFGILVHQTIEDIHKEAKEGRVGQITIDRIKEWLEINYRSLLKAGKIPITDKAKENALDQVWDYLAQNYDILDRIFEAEVDVSLETPNYILNGKIDLLTSEDGELELLDFKSQKRPYNNATVLRKYYNQLYMYIHILNVRYQIHPKRMYIYWTAERDKDSALMQIPIDSYEVKKAKEYFDLVVNSIQNKDFEVKETPDMQICIDCDFRNYCNSRGTIVFERKHKIIALPQIHAS
jgi:DNA helicase II / ATP-dependent DNA helicase PcrA